MSTTKEIKELRVEDFLPLLDGCRSALDGGAGAGDTAREMLAAGVLQVDAFEPFPGNHRFFDPEDTRITLHKFALGETPGAARFEVPSTVKEGTPGWEERVGYSSLGRLKSWSPSELKRMGRNRVVQVQVVRADDIVEHADFIKLDLQGGEFAALKGMKRLLASAKVVWVEFAGDLRVLDMLEEFELYTTELLFDKWTAWHEANLVLNRQKDSSLGVPFYFAWHGKWSKFKDQYQDLRKNGLIQTDIAAVRTLPAELGGKVL